MIYAAAIRSGGVIHTLPQPKRHHHIIAMMNERAAGLLIARGEQGFIDEHGNFLSREEAVEHAEKCGQLKKKLIAPPKLYSEDLW